MQEEADFDVEEIFARDSFDCFTGEESQWKEWSLKFQAAVKEESPEAQMGSIRDGRGDDVREQFVDAGLLHSTMVYNRLTTLLGGAAVVTHQSVPAECGHEA